MTTSSPQPFGEHDPESANDPDTRQTIRKDISQFEASIAHYPAEVIEDVAFINQIVLQELNGHYKLLPPLLRKEGKITVSEDYAYRLLSGRQFRLERMQPGKVPGGPAGLTLVKEIAEFLRRWVAFNSEAGGLPFVETPTWRELDAYIDAVSAPENPCKFGAICGSTGTGKSRMLKRRQLLHNQGNTAHIEAPSSGKLSRFQMKLGAAFGVAITTETSERLIRLNKCLTGKRTIIVDNVQKLYNPKHGVNQPVLNYLQEINDDTGCTIILSWTPVFGQTLADPANTQYFEQFIGRFGGLDNVLTLPEYAPMADLRAIADKLRVAGGKASLEVLRRWSREPGRLRILFRRLHLARLAANDDGSKDIRPGHLAAADLRLVPAPAVGIAFDGDQGRKGVAA